MKLLYLCGFLLLCGLAFSEETQEDPQEDAEIAEDENTEVEDPYYKNPVDCRVTKVKKCRNHCSKKVYYVTKCSPKCYYKTYYAYGKAYRNKHCKKHCKRHRRYRTVCKKKCGDAKQKQCRATWVRRICRYFWKKRCNVRKHCYNKLTRHCKRHCYPHHYYVTKCSPKCYYKTYYAYGKASRRRVCKKHCKRHRKSKQVCRRRCSYSTKKVCKPRKYCKRKQHKKCHRKRFYGSWYNVGRPYY